MKKTLVVASIACAVASAFSAYADETFPRYLNWFEAIGANATEGDVTESSSLDPSNGTWNVSATGDKTYDAANGFVFDLTSGYVSFAADQAAAPVSGTMTKVSMYSYFMPVICADYSELPSDSDMISASAQVGFMAVAQTNADQTSTFTYCAWTGNGWFELAGATPNDEEDVLATLEAEFDYRGDVPTVQFTLITNEVSTLLTTGSVDVVSKFGISSAAAAGDILYGLKCSGSGNVKSALGQIAEAIAEIDGKRFISLAEANAAAGSGDVIDVLAETDESITLADGATISNANGKVTGTITAGETSTVTIDLSASDINNGANGTYTVPIKTGGTGTIVVTQPLANKEIAEGTTNIVAGSSITVTIHTKTDLLKAMRPDEDNTDKEFAVDNTTNSPLRVFLEKNSSAYRAADASTESIQSELRGVPAESANGLKLWQDYVLTIEPETVVKPVSPAAGDTSTTDIKLEIPTLSGVSPRDGYTVTYKVYKEGVAEAVATAASADAIQIPLASGSGKYTVKAVLTPNNP